MKKKLGTFIVVVIVLVLALPLLNLIVGLPDNPLTDVQPQDPADARAVSTISTRCVQCHSRAPGLPFYSKLPIAGSLIQEDVEEGAAHIDYLSELGRVGEHPASEVALAKTEHVVREGSMPPRKYVMMHWNHGMSGDDREALQAWIDQTRVRNYAATDLPRAALGNGLFHDTRLSSDESTGRRSCPG